MEEIFLHLHFGGKVKILKEPNFSMSGLLSTKEELGIEIHDGALFYEDYMFRKYRRKEYKCYINKKGYSYKYTSPKCNRRIIVRETKIGEELYKVLGNHSDMCSKFELHQNFLGSQPMENTNQSRSQSLGMPCVMINRLNPRSGTSGTRVTFQFNIGMLDKFSEKFVLGSLNHAILGNLLLCFAGAVEVKFDGIVAESFLPTLTLRNFMENLDDAFELVAIAPPHDPGVVEVTISRPPVKLNPEFFTTGMFFTYQHVKNDEDSMKVDKVEKKDELHFPTSFNLKFDDDTLEGVTFLEMLGVNQMMESVMKGELSKVKDLLKNSGKKISELVNQKDIFGNTPLHYANFEGFHDIKELLLKNGALLTGNNSGVFPLDYRKKTYSIKNEKIVETVKEPEECGFDVKFTKLLEIPNEVKVEILCHLGWKEMIIQKRSGEESENLENQFYSKEDMNSSKLKKEDSIKEDFWNYVYDEKKDLIMQCGGKDVIFMEFDSFFMHLVLKVFRLSKDIKFGVSLPHLIWLAEMFLKNMENRNLNRVMFWVFENNKKVYEKEVHLLYRTILLSHLTKNLQGKSEKGKLRLEVKKFPSSNSKEFENHLRVKAPFLVFGYGPLMSQNGRDHFQNLTLHEGFVAKIIVEKIKFVSVDSIDFTRNSIQAFTFVQRKGKDLRKFVLPTDSSNESLTNENVKDKKLNFRNKIKDICAKIQRKPTFFQFCLDMQQELSLKERCAISSSLQWDDNFEELVKQLDLIEKELLKCVHSARVKNFVLDLTVCIDLIDRHLFCFICKAQESSRKENIEDVKKEVMRKLEELKKNFTKSTEDKEEVWKIKNNVIFDEIIGVKKFKNVGLEDQKSIVSGKEFKEKYHWHSKTPLHKESKKKLSKRAKGFIKVLSLYEGVYGDGEQVPIMCTVQERKENVEIKKTVKESVTSVKGKKKRKKKKKKKKCVEKEDWEIELEKEEIKNKVQNEEKRKELDENEKKKKEEERKRKEIKKKKSEKRRLQKEKLERKTQVSEKMYKVRFSKKSKKSMTKKGLMMKRRNKIKCEQEDIKELCKKGKEVLSSKFKENFEENLKQVNGLKKEVIKFMIKNEFGLENLLVKIYIKISKLLLQSISSMEVESPKNVTKVEERRWKLFFYISLVSKMENNRKKMIVRLKEVLKYNVMKIQRIKDELLNLNEKKDIREKKVHLEKIKTKVYMGIFKLVHCEEWEIFQKFIKDIFDGMKDEERELEILSTYNIQKFGKYLGEIRIVLQDQSTVIKQWEKSVKEHFSSYFKSIGSGCLVNYQLKNLEKYHTIDEIKEMGLIDDYYSFSDFEKYKKEYKFIPDDWQKDLMKYIDDKKSVFCHTPTSSGKTFMMKYLIKTVIRNNHDDLVIFISPTKALVNQFFALIKSSFKKPQIENTDKHLVGMWTGKVRVHYDRCQVLVITASNFETLLLSNSEHNKKLKMRIKYVIFDEIHNINDVETGKVWENIVHMIDSPFVCLSATIGNPKEFRDWLKNTSGKEVELIENDMRPVDLQYFVFNSTDERIVEINPIGLLNEHTEDSDVVKSELGCCKLTPKNSILFYEKVIKHSKDYSEELRKLNPKEYFKALGELDEGLKFFKIIPKKDLYDYQLKLKELLLKIFHEDREAYKKIIREINGNVENEFVDSKIFDEHIERLKDLRMKEYEVERKKEKENFDKIQRERVPKLLKKLREQRLFPCVIFRFSKHGVDELAREVYDFFQEKEEKEYLYIEEEKLKMEENQEEVEKSIKRLEDLDINEDLIDFLRLGIGVHHGGAPSEYKLEIEYLFFRKKLRVIIATGSLAMGVNLPVKTVVMYRDSIYLNSILFNQTTGRAGRRGFDSFGKVIFCGLKYERVKRLMKSENENIIGNLGSSPSFILRCLTKLNENPDFKEDFRKMVKNSLLTISREDELGREQIINQLYFSLQFLLKEGYIDNNATTIDFTGLITHLYWYTPSNFIFVNFLRKCLFHEFIKEEKKGDAFDKKKFKQKIMIILCHLFNTIERSNACEKNLLLPEMPKEFQDEVLGFKNKIARIFKSCLKIFADDNKKISPNFFPISKISLGRKDEDKYESLKIISLFSGLSGIVDDDFIDDISSILDNLRSDINFDTSSIPLPLSILKGRRLSRFAMDFYLEDKMTKKQLAERHGLNFQDIEIGLDAISSVLSIIKTSLSDCEERGVHSVFVKTEQFFIFFT